MSIIGKIGKGLNKTRRKIVELFQTVFSGSGADYYDLMEEFLILADVGPDVAAEIVAEMRAGSSGEPIATLKNKLIERLSVDDVDNADKPVKVFVGVNGSGKTTSIGKLSRYFAQAGKSVYIIGTDTFRAAADMQLEEWCRRTRVPYFVGKPGSDPASVLFDGLNSKQAMNADYILCDTAGRLHSSKNLLQEMAKILRVAKGQRPDQVEVLLTLDAATGQNALAQVEAFSQWLKPGGIILTKLDGSAKGGIAVALTAKYGIPIKYMGVGEQPDDFLPFSAAKYVDSLFADIVDRHD